MRSQNFVICLTLIVLGIAVICSASIDLKRRIAIVGAGMSGSSAAYHIAEYSKFSQMGVELTIFESQNIVGGRVRSAVRLIIAGKSVELGADVFHSENLLFYSLSKQFNISIEIENDDETGMDSFGLWDGEAFRFKSSEYWLLTLLQLLWKYGFDILKMRLLANDIVLNSWQRLYDDDKPWLTMEEFFSRYNLTSMVNVSTDNYLTHQLGFNQLFVDEIVAGILPSTIPLKFAGLTRGIYQRNPKELHAFAGLVSIVGTGGQLCHLKEGNSKLSHALIEASGATVHLQRVVTSIEKRGAEYIVHSETSLGQMLQSFDEVVVAVPLEIARIDFKGITPPSTNRKFSKLFVSYIHGEIDPSYFGLNSEADVPMGIGTVADSHALWTYSNTIHRFDNGSRIIKFFSPELLTSSELTKFFKLPPRPDPLPFIISPSLYYSSAFESGISVMEAALIGGRNVARLISETWNQSMVITTESETGSNSLEFGTSEDL